MDDWRRDLLPLLLRFSWNLGDIDYLRMVIAFFVLWSTDFESTLQASFSHDLSFRDWGLKIQQPARP
jgi:hypothetical protein